MLRVGPHCTGRMKRFSRTLPLRSILLLLAASSVAFASDAAGSGSLLITNNDVAFPFPNTVTLYALDATGAPTGKTLVPTGGSGIGGGFFAAARLAVVPSASNVCVFASEAASDSSDIAAIDAKTHTVLGRYPGSPTDSGLANGIGLASNSRYVYANFTSTSTIGTFQIQSGCALTFLGDLLTVGLNGGLVSGMAVRGNFMVVTYGDGSIESFDVSGGEPVTHGDAQLSTGAAEDHFPNGIDITKDGKFALFGDASTVSTIEVSDLSGGKLAPTTAYDLGQNWNSGNVRLSPDESMLYVTNDSGGSVTAAFFDKTTGIVSSGCASPSLTGYYTNWQYTGAAVPQLPTGVGGLLYVPEFDGGGSSSIGILQLTVSGGSCTLAETASSPIVDKKDTSNLLSVTVYPGRGF